jgi:hypothetical protein
MRAVALPAAASSGPRPRECAARRGQASPEHRLLAGPLTMLGRLSPAAGRSAARAGQQADGPVPAAEQTTTTRLPLAGQVRHDQLGHRQAQVSDVPDRAGEQPARPPPHPGHPAGPRHHHHRTAISQDHPARQRREQPVRRAAREHRRQLPRQIPPRRRHRQAHRRQHRRTLRSPAAH